MSLLDDPERGQGRLCRAQEGDSILVEGEPLVTESKFYIIESGAVEFWKMFEVGSPARVGQPMARCHAGPQPGALLSIVLEQQQQQQQQQGMAWLPVSNWNACGCREQSGWWAAWGRAGSSARWRW